ncbi:LexA family transcriptional regulator [Acinetobacter sp. R933-2]|uniref:LexA family protein n=1 Tax=Acinetobacter TaxID=469 RepID=UPI0025776B1C|nr:MULTISPECIES: LexA family transcriptional regulator [Acinetobacter]MDM1247890.1 LexA family transcriptional regulator [Acinetobacter sp. R933-2]MDQ9023321.1 LexA family transcriptional regulator [Acinetobacter sichuanensis]
MSTLADRLKEARLKANKTQGEVADAAGIKQPTYQALESGKTQKSAFLPEIADFLAVDVNWLKSGIGSMPAYTCKSESNVSFTNTPLRQIPLLDYVQAGLLNEVGYDGINPLGISWTTYENLRPECVFSLKVEGLSMAPEFQPGDELVVDGSLEAKPGSLVIAQEIQHGVARTTFKKYRVIGVNEFGVDVIELVPLNPDYPTLNSNQIEISIIGVVVAHNRSLKY